MELNNEYRKETVEIKKKYLYEDKLLHIFDLDDTLILRYDHDNIDYNKQMKEMLKNLAMDGKKLALASYNDNAECYLQDMGVLRYFDITIGEYPYGKNYKRKDAMINEILEFTGCQKEDAIFYDDNVHNIALISNMGIEVYYVKHGGIKL